MHHYKGDIIEHSGTGRLFRRDPDGTLETVMDGLHFANGVALDPQGDFVLVAETGMYRIVRLWLTGEKQGRSDVFAEMPGFPDNLSTGPSGTIWCAVASSRNKLLDMLLDKPPALRKLVWNLPDAVQPGPAKEAIVFGYDRDGHADPQPAVPRPRLHRRHRGARARRLALRRLARVRRILRYRL